MTSDLRCLRDPIVFLWKKDPHISTEIKFKAFPTYDFACPIIDSIEGVTHALSTCEYLNRVPLYNWILEKLGLRKIEVHEFSTLNFVNTCLSTRQLQWFVDNKLVDGWDDPRFPTVQGVMRRGMTVKALHEFMLDQGPSKNTNLMEWDKIWAINRNIIDPIAPRYNAISNEGLCLFKLENGPTAVEKKPVNLHPKDEKIGTKMSYYFNEIFIEQEDAKSIAEGEKITLISWGNCIVTKLIIDEATKRVSSIAGKLVIEDTDYKNTKKLNWICNHPEAMVAVELVEFDHIINKTKVEEKDDISKLVNQNSKISTLALAEKSVCELKQGAIIQFQRRGFFYLDEPFEKAQKIVFHFIPDGKSKSMSKLSAKVDPKKIAQGTEDPGKRKKQKKMTAEEKRERDKKLKEEWKSKH